MSNSKHKKCCKSDNCDECRFVDVKFYNETSATNLIWPPQDNARSLGKINASSGLGFGRRPNNRIVSHIPAPTTVPISSSVTIFDVDFYMAGRERLLIDTTICAETQNLDLGILRPVQPHAPTTTMGPGSAAINNLYNVYKLWVDDVLVAKGGASVVDSEDPTNSETYYTDFLSTATIQWGGTVDPSTYKVNIKVTAELASKNSNVNDPTQFFSNIDVSTGNFTDAKGASLRITGFYRS